ncbi:MAG: hypothetical protein IJ944_01530 [Clostridia bacterium]|nr:hypothetical protein [Clostridia bacterium]
MKKIILSISFILFCFLTVGVRIFELLVMIDKQSGFYLEKFNIISIIMVVIAFIGCFNFAFGSIITLKNESKERKAPKNSVLVGISSLLMALGIFYDMGQIALSTSEYNLGNYVALGLSFLSAITFVIYGVCYFVGKELPKIMSIIPVIWSVGQLIISYTRFNGIALASENITDIITLSFFMVFWLYHSKIISEINAEKSLSRLFIFGSCTAMLGLISTLPRFFVDYGLRVDFISSMPMVSFSNLTGAIYVICFMGAIYLQTVEKSVCNTLESDESDSVIDPPQFTVEVIDNFDVETETKEEN